MPLRGRRLALPLLILAGLTGPALMGCEDGDSKRRQEIQAIISDSSRALERASVAPAVLDDALSEQTRRELQGVIRTLQAVNDGAAGQQAAAALLASSAHRVLAVLDTAAIGAIEDEHRQERLVLDGRIESAPASRRPCRRTGRDR